MRISDWSSDVCSSDLYKTKAKNAQEAHEAIRPTDLFRRPQDVARALDDDHRRLYELIWKRTVACEMESAVLDQMAVDLTRSEEHTSELQSLMRISYAVFCLKKKKKTRTET